MKTSVISHNFSLRAVFLLELLAVISAQSFQGASNAQKPSGVNVSHSSTDDKMSTKDALYCVLFLLGSAVLSYALMSACRYFYERRAQQRALNTDNDTVTNAPIPPISDQPINQIPVIESSEPLTPPHQRACENGAAVLPVILDESNTSSEEEQSNRLERLKEELEVLEADLKEIKMELKELQDVLNECEQIEQIEPITPTEENQAAISNSQNDRSPSVENLEPSLNNSPFVLFQPKDTILAMEMRASLNHSH